MKAAVIGAGNGGRALSAFLRLHGWEVVLYNRPDPLEVETYLEPVRQAGGIRVEGVVNGFATGIDLTTDLARALAGTTEVFVVAPAFAHRGLATEMAPHLGPRSRVVLLPGRTLGAWEFAREVALSTPSSGGLVVAEMHSLPFACRLQPAGGVRISGIKRWLLLGAVPSAAAEGLVAGLSGLFSGLRQASSILTTGFSNLGAMIHPATLLLNAARVEQLGGGYPFYREGVSPSVCRVIEAVDEERVRIARAWGVEVPSLLQATCETYGFQASDLFTALRTAPPYEIGDMPYTLQHRYVHEDVPTGLVPLLELARVAGVPAPAMEAVVRLAQTMERRDFVKEGRNLDRLGLGGLGTQEIVARLATGPFEKLRAWTKLNGKGSEILETSDTHATKEV